MEDIVPGESSTIKLSKQLTKLWFQETTDKLYMQQQFLITYVNKGKGRIQTPAATPKGIQLPSWKKHRVESPTAPSYYYTPRSAINISSADAFISNTTLTFGRFQFQSKQRKEDLLGPYTKFIQQPLQLPPQQPV
ncbi:hypothetical protein G9A89_011810 [Geosiphon pyriformis]|nr:hypothetical protein G9A89_011810 [Geosiphon pyriformis]